MFRYPRLYFLITEIKSYFENEFVEELYEAKCGEPVTSYKPGLDSDVWTKPQIRNIQ